jgi:hypothetical protein
MRPKVALMLVLGWLLGIATGIFGVAATGSMYEYRRTANLVASEQLSVDQALRAGWEPVPGNPSYLRRSKLRLP